MQTGNLRQPVRHVELDVVKGLGIIFMVLVHVLTHLYPYCNENTIYTRVILTLGRFPAAPCFMFCLGAGVVMSRKNTPSELFRRGLQILGLGYLGINLFAYMLPYVIQILMSGGALSDTFPESILLLLIVDILQFAGVTFFYFALIKFGNWKDWQVVIVTVCISILGTVLRNCVNFSNLYLISVMGLFWGTSYASSFPFTSWVIYPVAGYLFGKRILSDCRNKTKVYAVLTVVGGVLYAGFSYFSFKTGVSFANFGELCDPAQYYHMSLGGNIAVLSFVAMWIGLCYFLMKLLPGWALSIFQSLSKHITLIYVIHDLCILYLPLIVGHSVQLTEWGVLLTTLVILVISELLSVIIVSFQGRYHTR